MLLEVNKFCQDHRWLRSIHQFLKKWGPQKLKLMQSWPAARYTKLITELESWQSQVSEVPTMLLTENLLLHINCNCVQTDIGEFSSSLSVRYNQSQELIKELSEFIQVLQNISADIQTIARCSQKLTEANEKSEDLEERVEYVLALSNLVRSHFGKLTYEDEELEIALLDVWETFLFERLQASEFLLSKQSTLVPQLKEMIAAALEEMEDLSIQAVSGPFIDPTQEQRSIQRQLINMERTYVSISVRLAELHHAYVILSGTEKLCKYVGLPLKIWVEKKSSILGAKQDGLIKNKNKNTNLISFSDKVINLVDQRNAIVPVFVNFSKAFINCHLILIHWKK
uniref:Dynein heavy chain tail domain-containing protein n=1 Tax=Vombatus ursinus TaxID=29139 RepID=A0A4X2K820_VOMUR